MNREISDDKIQRIGELAEKASNFHAAAKLSMPDQFHKKHLNEGMKTLRDELRSLYRDITGEDPWEGHPLWED